MILALETATAVASVAVIDKGKLIGEFFTNTSKNHSQSLMPLVDSLLRFVAKDIEEVAAFALAIGPGSFTGLRIGLATVKGMCIALNKPAIGVSTLDGLAMNVSGAQGLICPLLDARKSEVYTAVYNTQDNELCRLTDYMAVAPSELMEQLAKYDQPVTILGDAVDAYPEVFKEPFLRKAAQGNRWPRAAQVAQLAWQRLQRGEVDDIYNLAPFYIRRSEAEVSWESKHGTGKEV
ncbi:tRNA (adenosine(37)-N6)-threonylcarbamoyltransferase complex dimerization subunit type 1 TsaB [Metallumcola ferriviriculae]|uniref:tRNA (Adenosine(37)-N6)-threonylcarbamoyltransferase complex dimerization subunit type 1 TsaB n=1 Tax=Metallumcola ferriviriculae TaxID=3039180 RepID=A0AAU0USJ4_9FIRM|nr:tRNA (adenosine(37)-N6)-threonylcarbamoyltransferase complex dimerization subunit type 1 TsaB [Desulfitibacteraceae bacterium MK1]